ncbi:MAG: hypothetical protein LBK06_01580 [Planctomycetaceae bacterium]|jgi:hypothetical protein|nr:hypothetical protein [Planctomycetaceae bacterium]
MTTLKILGIVCIFIGVTIIVLWFTSSPLLLGFLGFLVRLQTGGSNLLFTPDKAFIAFSVVMIFSWILILLGIILLIWQSLLRES